MYCVIVVFIVFFIFFFKQKTAYELLRSLVGSEMCIRDSYWFLPRLDDALGVLFPLILIMAAVAAVWLVFKSKNRVVRVLALASLATAVVYLGTPLTAAGQEGQPRGFFTNTRYLMPGLILALTLLPLVRQLRIPKKRANQTLIFLTIVFAVTVLTSPKWYPSFVPGALFLVIAIVWAPVGLTWLKTSGRFKDRPRLGNGITVGVVGAIILIAGVWGRGEEVGYANKHYTRDTLFLQDGGPRAAFSYTRDLRDKRIAIAGSGEIFFGQYGFYGVARPHPRPHRPPFPVRFYRRARITAGRWRRRLLGQPIP